MLQKHIAEYRVSIILTISRIQSKVSLHIENKKNVINSQKQIFEIT